MRAEIGPIWRSTRRHRAFSLLVLEVAMGFFIVGNLIITCRWYASLGVPPSGHREVDLVEVTSRGPTVPEARRRREIQVLTAIPGVRVVAPVSSTQIDDQWALPNVFWTAPGVRPGPVACEGVARSSDGVVIGWGVDAGAALGDAVDFKFVEGRAPSPSDRPGTVVITRCLRDALFGATTPAVGQTLLSNRHPPARIVGVIEDIRMRVPFLYQTNLTAIFTAPAWDPRTARYLIRTEPGRAAEVRAAAARALDDPQPDPDRIVTARLFSLEQTRSARIAIGTVVVLAVVGGSLGVVAVLGNLAIAAFLVGDRRRVIGVRRALGATRWDIFRYLLIENLLPTQLGNLLGLIVVVLSLPMAQKLFSGLRLGIIDVVATALLLSVGGIAAKLLPALRATRIPPSEVSRAL